MTRTTTRHKPALSRNALNSSQPGGVRSRRILPIWFVVMTCSMVLSVAFGKWLVYPARSTADSSASRLAIDFRVDVNHADVVTLAGLPGLGMVTGQLIIDHRQKHGRFSEPAQLMQVKGIGEGKLRELVPWIICGQGVAPTTSPESLTHSSPQASTQKMSTQKSGGPIGEPPLVEDSVMSVELTR